MRQALAVVAAVLVLAVSVGGAYWWLDQQIGAGGPDAADPGEAADAYLAAWAAGDHEGMAALVRDPPEDFVAVHDQLRDGLEIAELSATRDEPSSDVDGRATVPASVVASIPDLGDLAWEVELPLLRERGTWGVAWQPTSLHPQWRPGLTFTVTREVVERLPIEAVDGTALAGPAALVTFGFEPGTVRDTDEVVDAFEDAIPGSGETADRLLSRGDLRDGWFYPVESLPAADADDISQELTRIPGVLRRSDEGRRSLLADGFAVHVVGRVGDATAEQLEQLGPDYEAGDQVGQFGLEAVFEGQLGPAERVTAQLRDGVEGPVRATLGSGALAGGGDGVDSRVRTTLDVTVQRAIENALVGREEAAAIVVVDGEDGAVRGSASRPLSAFNRAFEGRYPPGSTFSLVTAEAAFADGDTPGSEVACPSQATVGGVVVDHPDGDGLGETTLVEAFAATCDPTFATLGGALGASALDDAAARFGFGVDPAATVAAFGAAFPEPADAGELGVAAVGGGRVEVSPLHLASVVAATVDGSWHQPYLLADEGPGEARELTEGAGEALRELLAAATPGETEGLVGIAATARVGGSQDEHAWFVGTIGGLGVSVLVEDDRDADVAASLGDRFARELLALREASDDDAETDEDA